jgi:rRNA maturation protein Nop10
MAEILFNEKLGDYTFKSEIDGVKSVKKVPIKFKGTDSTSKYRKEILKKEIFD